MFKNRILNRVIENDSLKSESVENFSEKELLEALSPALELSRLRIRLDQEQLFQKTVSYTIHLKLTFATICYNRSELNKFYNDQKKLGDIRAQLKILRHQRRKLSAEMAKNVEHQPKVEHHRKKLAAAMEREFDTDNGLASNFTQNLLSERVRMVREINQLQENLQGFHFELTPTSLEQEILTCEAYCRRVIQIYNFDNVSLDSNF